MVHKYKVYGQNICSSKCFFVSSLDLFGWALDKKGKLAFQTQLFENSTQPLPIPLIIAAAIHKVIKSSEIIK